ncbi:MAG: glutamate--tRNA ligase [Planctomycetota bacterium]
MSQQTVRVRFAPSPTGFLHIGNARTALYNWLFARHERGVFILRIEDTDRVRSTQEAIAKIFDAMKWLGLDWDEGPYFQSERLDLYREWAKKLLDAGKAYESTDAEKGTAIKFRMEHAAAGFDDLLHGRINFDASLIEDFVLLKSDGFPTYNFACVVDDCLMKITHVIRGDDHISNTPKQLALFAAFGAEPPKYVHLPMIHKEGGGKESKREGAQFVGTYREAGFLSDALVNFLALLGWYPGEDKEVISRQEMIARFTLEGLSKTPSQFNLAKLEWMNGAYIRAMSPAELAAQLDPFLQGAGIVIDESRREWFVQLVALYQERLKNLSEFAEKTRFFFSDDFEYEPDAVEKVLKKDSAAAVLRESRAAVAALNDLSIEALEGSLRGVAERLGVGFKKVAQPLRVAVTGGTASAGLFETMALLGKETVLRRVDRVIEKLNSL